jgi:hypothetical protein
VRRSLPSLLAAARRARRLPALERVALALEGTEAALAHGGRALAPRRQATLTITWGRRGDIGRTLARLRRAIAARQRADGSFAGSAPLTAQGALVLAGDASRAHAVRAAARWLVARQHADSAFGPGSGDAGTTGAALVVLSAGGEHRDALRRGLGWLRAAQLADGGFGRRASRRSNALSTALAIRGLLAAGADPARLRTEDGISPVDLLRALQRRSGAIAYGSRAERTRAWVSALAVPALALGDLLHPLQAVDAERGAG